MIRVACFSYNNAFLSNFHHDEIIIEYFNDLDIIEYSIYDFVIIINDKNNVDLVKCLDMIKTKFNKTVYIIDKEYNDELVKKVFKKGLDDYLTFPIENEYLIQKIINDFYKREKKHLSYYKYETLIIDFNAYTVLIDYDEIKLTKIEFKLLKFLIENLNKAVSRKEIIANIWGYDSNDYRTIETHIKTLRKKIKQYKSNIITVWSYGYAFMENNKKQ
ncbi:DNA-binding response OmpR family regulator [Bacilli bacterium PM5-3]|nr:DNA-binding response OmpR family regulator [Bacilli bacterium PM5-3]MDH6603613.1 DNA-binding response OmpR family regulator [Bacilli bacterium PM5-9]